MADDPIARELAQFRLDIRDDFKDVKDDFTEVKARLDKLVPREVYDLQHQELTKRVQALEQARADDAKRLRDTLKWVVGAVLVPTLIGLGSILLTLRGTG